jgi:hypothetical protein
MAPATRRLLIGDTDMPAGFVPQTVLSSAQSQLILQAPPGVIRWTLDGDSCSVNQTWLVVPEGGSPGGGGFGGAGCPWAPHLSIGARGSLATNGADFSVIGGRVLPAENVQIRVELANGDQMTVQPHDAMWLVIVQRCGDYEGTEIRSVELLGLDGALIERKILPPARSFETTTRIVLRTGGDEDPIVDHPAQPSDYVHTDGTVWTWRQRWRMVGRLREEKSPSRSRSRTRLRLADAWCRLTVTS